MSEKFVGIDVSKYAFDLNVNGNDKVEHFTNDVKGVRKCSKSLVKLAPALVVIVYWFSVNWTNPLYCFETFLAFGK